MLLNQRIVKYLLKRDTTTLQELEKVVVSAGYTLDELYATLEQVHKDKRISYTANASGEIMYRKATARSAPPTSHLTWLRDNYPPMDDTNDGSGIEIDMGFLFLRTKEERDAYKAAATGKPVHMIQSRYGNTRR